MLGRTFLESETGVPPAPVIILGYDLWQRKFNGDPHIVGKTVRMSRRETPPTVIGVMPPGVRFLPSPGAAQEPNYNVNAHGGFLAARGSQPGAGSNRRDGMWWAVCSPASRSQQAQAELELITARQAQAEHDFEGFTPQAANR